MSVYLNILPSIEGDETPNEVIALDSLTRRDILDWLDTAMKEPQTYSLAVADALKKVKSPEERAKTLTLSEYLERNNIVVSDGDFHLLATRVSKEYVRAYGEKPEIVHRESPVTGKRNNKAYAYAPGEVHIINEVLKTIPHVVNLRK
ncbi:hypothetical protein [Nostoc sp.]|uniref:hypothetical protein n=1 Tax=Nostoc sp. TaxID=1180 RepID=UPI002FF7F4F9